MKPGASSFDASRPSGFVGIDGDGPICSNGLSAELRAVLPHANFCACCGKRLVEIEQRLIETEDGWRNLIGGQCPTTEREWEVLT